MTNEEAIRILSIAKAEVEWDYPLDYTEAFEMAIKVLEKQIPQKPWYADDDDIYSAYGSCLVIMYYGRTE